MCDRSHRPLELSRLQSRASSQSSQSGYGGGRRSAHRACRRLEAASIWMQLQAGSAVVDQLSAITADDTPGCTFMVQVRHDPGLYTGLGLELNAVETERKPLGLRCVFVTNFQLLDFLRSGTLSQCWRQPLVARSASSNAKRGWLQAHLVNSRCCHPLLKVVQGSIVQRYVWICDGGNLTSELYNLLELRCKHGEVLCCSCFRPGFIALGVEAGLPLRQLLCQTSCLLVTAAKGISLEMCSITCHWESFEPCAWFLKQSHPPGTVTRL